MELTTYEIVYITMNLFRTFIVFKYMCIFYSREEINKKIEWISYIGFYIVITIMYLIVNVPIIMMVSNLLGFFLLSFNYKSALKQRILSSLLIYIILLCIESILALVTGYINFPVFNKNYYSSIFGVISVQMFSYLGLLVLQNYEKIKNGEIVTISYWIGILTIPTASLFIIITLFTADGLSVSQVILCILFLFGINIVAFSLYDNVVIALESRMAEKIVMQQNQFYEKQFETMKTSIENTRAVRHDLINHLYIIQSLNQKKEADKINEYLQETLKAFDNKKVALSSANLIIDSIVNFKVQEAEQKKIKMKIEVSVPERLNITSFDMTVMLGNLFDNAMNAVSKLEESKREIDFEMHYRKGILVIKMSNYFQGIIPYKDGKIVTSKADKENHGMGLSNVNNTVKKYQGRMEIAHTEDVFSVTAILFARNL